MNARGVLRLVSKDCYLMRLSTVIYVLAALASLALAASGNHMARSAGVTLALNVLIGVTFHVMLGPVLGERERKTLAFVMSLPVTPGDAAVAKMLSAFSIFLVPAVLAATTLVFLSPVDVFHRMALSHQSVWSHLLGWAAYYALALGAWMLFFSAVLMAAIVSESVGWTIATLTGLLFVFGNFALQVLPQLKSFGWYLSQLGRGGPALPITIAVELLGLALVVMATLHLQGRKTSFV